MRAFLPVVLVLLLLPIACADDDSAPTRTADLASPTVHASATLSPTLTNSSSNTPSPLTTTTPTPVGSAPTSLHEFVAFVSQIEDAIQSKDADFFANRGVEIEMTCRGDEQLGPCSGQPSGAVIRGIPGAAWHSDTSALFPRHNYRTTVADWFAAALPAQADNIGGGAPRLAALAWRRDNGEFYAIATLIADAGPPAGIQRQTRVFRFLPGVAGIDWALSGELFGAVSATSADWLSGTCAECYDYWQPWTE
jgi:hypothetical protein